MLHSKNSRYHGGSLKTPHTFGYFFTVTCTGIKPGRTTVTMYGVPGRLAVPLAGPGSGRGAGAGPSPCRCRPGGWRSPWQALGAVGERKMGRGYRDRSEPSLSLAHKYLISGQTPGSKNPALWISWEDPKLLISLVIW